MARMTGGEAIVDSLLRHGIDTVFGLPGVQTYGLFDAFARASNSLRLINARHEQTTAYMALGYACATGRPSAYAVVPGPGVLNTGAALATAWGVNAPVLCLTGQVPSMMIGRGRGQLHELPDQLATLRSLLKWVERIEHPSQASHLTARAFQEMLSGRPGPVALEMPWDQFTASAEITPQEPLPLHPKPQPDPERIAALAKLLDEAKAPMLWVGGGAQHASAEIRALAAHINAPVVSFRSGRGIIDDRSPLSMTVASAYKLWPKTDLLVAFGTRLEVPTSRWGALPAGLKIARIDIDPVEMRRLKADVPIVADSADAARALAAVAEPRSDPARAEAIAQAKADAAQAIQKVQPQMSFLDVIRDVLPENGIFCDEMTQVGYVSWFGLPIYAPRTLITSGFSGTLGAGFPTALGVKVAMPDRPVVAVTGDGGFGQYAAELTTAVKYGIPVKHVLFDNHSLGKIGKEQLAAGFPVWHTSLHNPDWAAYARLCGATGIKAVRRDQLEAAMTQLFAADGPAMLHVEQDPELL